MNTTLRQDIERASAFCERMIAEKGEVFAMWDVTRANGERAVMPQPPGDKAAADRALRRLFRDIDAVRCLFICEAWAVKFDEQPAPAILERMDREGVEAHPRRVEIVNFWGEDREQGQLIASREIVRLAGRATLGPLVFQDFTAVEGRFIGMLPAACEVSEKERQR